MDTVTRVTEEGSRAVATKGSKQMSAKKGKAVPAKAPAKAPASRAAAVPAGKTRAAKGPGSPPARAATPAATRAAAPTRIVAPASRSAPPPLRPLTLLEQTEHLRNEIHRTKLSHPDPWSYTARARAWGERAQQLVEAIATSGESPDRRRAFKALSAEVQADKDFRLARDLL